jgi:AcrR family transcriptional regulator
LVEQALTISALAKAAGVARSTVDYYVREGLLPSPMKTASGRCLYTVHHARLLERIGELKGAGLSLAQIRAELEPSVDRALQQVSDLAMQERDRTRRAILRAAAEEFESHGYEQSQVATIIQKAGVTPHAFYSRFSGKARLLVECFDAFVDWNTANRAPLLARIDDVGERLLLTLSGNLRSQGLGAEVLALVRSEEVDGRGELRVAAKRVWEKVVAPIARDLGAMRGPRSAAVVPDELVAFSLVGAFDSTYLRSTWDQTYTREDLLRTHLWLYLAVQAAMSGVADVGCRMGGYEARIREIADETLSIWDFDPHEEDPYRRVVLRVATREFATRGYERTHVAAIIREAGLTPQTFYALFPSKRRLLVDCFESFLRWNAALVDPEVAAISDPSERLLLYLGGNLRSQVLGIEMSAVIRSEGQGGESGLRSTAKQAWAIPVGHMNHDLAAMRPHGQGDAPVPDELIAYSLIGAFDNTYVRSTWDATYTRDDLLRTHLWLCLTIQAAMAGEIDVSSRIDRYGDAISEAAGREEDVTPAFAG